MKEMRQKKQTALSAEKLFTFRVSVLVENKLVGHSLLVAHDSREAKGMMIDRLTDAFSVLDDRTIDLDTKIIG